MLLQLMQIVERYLTGQVAGCPSGSLNRGHLINGITQCGGYTVCYYSVAPGLIVYDIYDALSIMYPALSAIGMKLWQKYQEMEKGYRETSKRGMVTAIASAVCTAVKMVAAAGVVVGTIHATGSLLEGLEAGKRFVYA